MVRLSLLALVAIALTSSTALAAPAVGGSAGRLRQKCRPKPQTTTTPVYPTIEWPPLPTPTNIFTATDVLPTMTPSATESTSVSNTE
ncbi:hypothetical protein BJ085DRAFT_37289, partial [Dimargaris cristalligena]